MSNITIPQSITDLRDNIKTFNGVVESKALAVSEDTHIGNNLTVSEHAHVNSLKVDNKIITGSLDVETNVSVVGNVQTETIEIGTSLTLQSPNNVKLGVITIDNRGELLLNGEPIVTRQHIILEENTVLTLPDITFYQGEDIIITKLGKENQIVVRPFGVDTVMGLNQGMGYVSNNTNDYSATITLTGNDSDWIMVGGVGDWVPELSLMTTTGFTIHPPIL